MHGFLAAVTFTPGGNALPGGTTLQNMINTLGTFAMLACVAAAVIGGVMWAFGAASSNAASASKGQKTVGGAVIGALVIGAAAVLVNFFFNAGQTLK
jgi:type IV secretory pathway VirB2 component (pilin)